MVPNGDAKYEVGASVQVREINNNLYRLDMSENNVLRPLFSCCCLESLSIFILLVQHASPTRNKDVIAIQSVMGLQGVIFSLLSACSLLRLIND